MKIVLPRETKGKVSQNKKPANQYSLTDKDIFAPKVVLKESIVSIKITLD